MKKKFLLTMLVISVLTLMGSGKLSAQNVAKIGETEYATLQLAVNAAANGQTITLINDVIVDAPAETDIVTIIGKELTIDLASFTIEGQGSVDDIFNIAGIAATETTPAKGANVTIKNGTIKHNYCGIYSYGENAENVIVLDHVTINDNGKADHSAIYHNGTNFGCNLTIKNSTISSQYYGLFISGSNSWGDKLNNVRIENSTIESTTVEEEGSAVEVKQGNLYVTSSTITKNTKLNASFNNNGNGTCSSGYAIALTNNGTSEVSKGECTISGSSIIHGQIGIKAGNGGTGPINNNENAEILIYGGNITDCSIIEYYLASGYKYDSNTATVTPTADGVAQIAGNDPYSTLQEAVDAVNASATDPTTITLFADVILHNQTVEIVGKKIIFNLNGKTVKAVGEYDDVFTVKGIAATNTGANVTIQNGRIEHSSCGIISRGEDAANVIKLNGVTIDDGGDANHSAIYHNGTKYGCNLTIENSTISSQYYGLFISGSNSWDRDTEKFNIVSIKNSTITSTTVEEEGTAVEIKRGKLTVENSIITAKCPTINMSDNGNGTCSSGFAIALTNNGTETSTGEVNIYSGTFEGAIGIKGEGGTVIANTETAKISISGGTFSNENLPDGLYTTLLGGYCAEGYELEENPDGTYGIVIEEEEGNEHEAVIGDTKYSTIEAAITYANTNGGTVTLLRNATIESTIVLTNNIILDGGQHYLTYDRPDGTTISAARAINVDYEGDVVIKNLTILAEEAERAINVINKKANLTIENVNATAANYTLNVANTTTGAKVSVTGGSFTGLNVVNIAGPGADVTIEGTTLTCNDQNVNEEYAALFLNRDAKGGKITYTTGNSEGIVVVGNDSHKAVNGAENGIITIDGSIDDVDIVVATIDFGNSYYSYITLSDAFDKADATGKTIKLIRDIETTTVNDIVDKSITIDFNNKICNEEFNIINGGELYILNGNNISGLMQKEVAAYSVRDENINWATISSPIGTVEDLSDVDGLLTEGENTYGLYRYNEGLELWENKLATNEFTTLESGRGYIYANSNGTNIIFDGTFNTGTKRVTLTNSSNGSYKGFNLIGNPFTHSIDLSDFSLDSREAAISIGYYSMSNEGAWTVKTEGEIAPMESVFIKTNTNNVGLNIMDNNTRGAKSRGENNGMLEINVANAKYNDVAYVSFNKGLGLDKIAHRNDEIPMVYVPVNGTDYAIAMMNKDVTEIPVSFMAMTMGEYTFSAKAIDCEFEQMYLVDRMTGVETNLLLEDYTFMAKSGDNTERFIIRLENSANANTNTENFVFVNNDELIFNNIAGEGIIRIIDVLGRPVAEYNVYGSANISTTSFRSGVYMIQMSDENGVKVQKVIVD